MFISYLLKDFFYKECSMKKAGGMIEMISIMSRQLTVIARIGVVMPVSDQRQSAMQ